MLKGCYIFLFLTSIFWHFSGKNFLSIQVVQRDYLNPSLGSPTGLFLEFRSPGRWDYAICRALVVVVVVVVAIVVFLRDLHTASGGGECEFHP